MNIDLQLTNSHSNKSTDEQVWVYTSIDSEPKCTIDIIYNTFEDDLYIGSISVNKNNDYIESNCRISIDKQDLSSCIGGKGTGKIFYDTVGHFEGHIKPINHIKSDTCGRCSGGLFKDDELPVYTSQNCYSTNDCQSGEECSENIWCDPPLMCDQTDEEYHCPSGFISMKYETIHICYLCGDDCVLNNDPWSGSPTCYAVKGVDSCRGTGFQCRRPPIVDPC